MNQATLPDWPRAFGGPIATGTLRQLPEDFRVVEQLAFEPSGEGEHVFLQVQKISENTEYIARQIARFAGVRQRDIGYAGLKDRHAITSQWFSVWLPGKIDPDWSELESEQLKILHVVRHARKLKRGVLAANHFSLRIKELQGDFEQIEAQLNLIKRYGVPNYFGGQRFGNAGQNLQKAIELFQGVKFKHEQRSIYLSAARAYLFNLILAERMRLRLWQQGMAGDCFMFDASKAFFKTVLLDDEIKQRLDSGMIHPTGPLWGLGEDSVSEAALKFESELLNDYSEWRLGLEREQLTMARRALRVMVRDLEWRWLTQTTLELSFSLPPGSFATAVVREMIET